MTSRVTAEPRRSAVPAVEADRHGLAGEHAELLRDVRRRAAPVLALASARTWPAAELRTLTGFLRTVVLRQASDEERLFFPGDRTAAPFAELSTDHLRLHVLARQLQDAAERSCSLPALTDLVQQLLATLERHLTDEQAVLAALPGAPRQVPGTAELGTDGASWAGPAGDAVILLDALPAEQAVQLSIERLLRMRTGESTAVVSSNAMALQQVWDWMRRYDTAGYGFSHAQTGPQRWQLQITCRQAG